MILPSERNRLVLQAGFAEGPEGEKAWKSWFAKQPEDFQEEWKKNTETYGDKFKNACGEELMDTQMNPDAEEAMYAEGENVPLSKLPVELQENVKNPPPSVEKLKKKMEESMMMKTDDMLPSEMARMRAAAPASKEAASGMYGFTKSTQRDVEVLVRRARKKASAIARAVYAKDERIAPFLQMHAKRAKSSSAKILLAALQEIGPKIAGGKVAASTPLGLYGFPSRTARMGLIACADFRGFCGEASYDLHTRRQAKFERITGFLQEHSKQAKCGYSRMLLGCWPDAPKTAGDISDLPPALQEQAQKMKDKGKDNKEKDEPKKKDKKAQLELEAKFPPKAVDFNRVQDSDGFWEWPLPDAMMMSGTRFSPKNIGDVIFSLNMWAGAWERTNKQADVSEEIGTEQPEFSELQGKQADVSEEIGTEQPEFSELQGKQASTTPHTVSGWLEWE